VSAELAVDDQDVMTKMMT